MRFAYAGIDFLADAYAGLVAGGWEPVKLFTRPCDGVHDVNDQVVAAFARRRPGRTDITTYNKYCYGVRTTAKPARSAHEHPSPAR